MSLLWFHATTRKTPADYVRLLRLGLHPATFTTQTQQLELHLRIVPHRVYCYLGRTLETFGDFGLALRPDALADGELSPFDTGGLVRNISPVRDWPQPQQQTYLQAFSFPTAARNDCLLRHPSAGFGPYLRGEKPGQRGPHELWTGPEADIWSLASEREWRAWTWEGRWQELPIAGHIAAWTCTPAMFPEIVEATESADVPPELLEPFLRSYHAGGVGALVADLRERQAA